MSGISKGAVSAGKNSRLPSPKLGDFLTEQETDAISYITRAGVDGAFVIPPGPKFNAQTGARIGWDEGVYLDFQGVGVTKPLTPKTNSVHRATVERIAQAIEDGLPIIQELGIEVLQPKAPRPPFGKWDKTSAAAIKVALSVMFEDDHDANVEVVKNAARYEASSANRKDVLDVLQGLLAVEASESDAYDVEVNVS